MASDNHDYSNVSKTIELDFDRNDLAFAKSAEVKPFIYSIELNESISSSFDAKLVIYLKKKEQMIFLFLLNIRIQLI